MMNAKLIRQLKDIVGDEYVMETLEDRICYSFDATFKDALPDVVVRPGTTEEIVKIVKLAGQHGIPVTARGSATGLSGGAVPVRGGIALVLGRLNKILSIV
jgi:glycolate oxidase